jgi:pimeloyl-ACP methyl ester carboxylesterase
MDGVHGLPLTGPGLRALGANPSPPPLPAQIAEPAGFMVAMDGAVRIHFLDWGGPTTGTRGRAGVHSVAEAGGNVPASRHYGGEPGVLLIHGLAQTAWSWAPVARRVRAMASVVAMDLRGHGLSDAPTDGYDHEQLAEDAIAVAEGAGLLAYADDAGPDGTRPFVVAGHGFGAVVAAWTAHALGDRCAGLVLVDGGWTDLPAETGMTPDEWLAAIAEPPEVLRSMDAWLADRNAFDPATWDADQERAARSEVVETAASRVKPAIHGHALAASVGALWTYRPASTLPAVVAEVAALAARDNDAGRSLQALRVTAAARAGAGRGPVHAASFPGLGHNLMRYVPNAVVAAIRTVGAPPADAGADASG